MCIAGRYLSKYILLIRNNYILGKALIMIRNTFIRKDGWVI